MPIRSILLVDDSKTELHFLSDLLGRRGYAVRTAENGEDAMRRLSEETPDLILMDVLVAAQSKSADILSNLQGLVAARDAQAVILGDSEKVRMGLEAVQLKLAQSGGFGFFNLALLLLSGAALAAGGFGLLRLFVAEQSQRALQAQGQRQEAERQEQEAKRVNDANQAAILRLMNELQTVAEGDLTQQATVTEDITGAIADSVNYTVEELRSLVTVVQNTAERVSDTTSQVEQTSTELLAVSTEQLREIRETGESVLQMAGRINEVSAQAQATAQVARQSLAAAQSGLSAVQDTIGGMNTIRDQIQDTSKRIKRLGESSQEIAVGQGPALLLRPRTTAANRFAGVALVDYETPRLGQFDPAWLAQGRKRVAAAKDVWSAVTSGERTRQQELAEQFNLVGDTLKRLYPNGDALAQALEQAVAAAVRTTSEPPAALAMEVATSMLYLEASLDDAEFDHPDMPQRVQRLARRIGDAAAGQPVRELDGWMEELYRRVSDRQMMGSVVQELRASLGEVEAQIDRYFREPSQREVLMPVPAKLKAMRGVLSVLNMDQASQAVQRMSEDVNQLCASAEPPTPEAAKAGCDRVADNLSALSFMIDMLNVQPHLAKALFRFDAEHGSLRTVMAMADRVTAFGGLEPTPVVQADAGLLDRAAELAAVAERADVSHDTLTRDLERMSQHAL
ncbi:hypothetical protein B566_EDAN018916, partial [Ephemera danica]